MIFDVREDFYAAIPKGPIMDEHFLIIPKQHIGHSIELSDQQEEQYFSLKKDLIDYLTNKRKLDYILFERNIPFKFQKASHMNV